MMQIAIVGSGSVATHFVQGLKAQQQIVQVFSRQLVNAQVLAQQVHAQPITRLADLDDNLDVILLCVSDQAIAEVSQQLANRFKSLCAQPLILHCSGSTDLSILSRDYARCGVLYPLQTFSLEKAVNWSKVPLLLESNLQADVDPLQQLANTLSQKLYFYNSAQRLSLHLAAVFACNFANCCYDMAQQITQTAQIDFELLHPLIVETAKKATQFTPHQVQTGPAVRGDFKILTKHQQLLTTQPELLAVYQQLSAMILHRHEQ